jgi:hypothetical protein
MSFSFRKSEESLLALASRQAEFDEIFSLENEQLIAGEYRVCDLYCNFDRFGVFARSIVYFPCCQ